MKQSPIRLSQCMIVKNEEQNIEKALSWGRGIVCEQIVVDTGSDDRTVELAEKMGASVYHFPWIDDFAAAKNYAIEQACGNWIAFLDADEYFSEEDSQKLLPLLEQIHANQDVDLLRTAWVHLQEDGSVMAVSCQDRIFRNDPALRYRYRIHEELHHGRKKELHHYDAQESLRIFHTGYGRQTDQQEKAARNARLLERDLQDNPTDASRLMYLGDAYGSMQGRQQEALDCYRKVLWDRQMQVEDPVVLLRSGIQILSMLQNEPTEETEDEYFRISGELRKQGYDMHPDVDYFMGLWHLKAGELKKAALLFESAMGKLADYRGVDVVRMISNMEMVNWAISAAALESGNPQKAVPFAVSALRINKYSPEGIQLLLSAFQTEFSPGMDAEPYWQFLCRIYDTGNLKDMLFVRKFAEDVGFQEIRQRAEQMLPPEARD